MTMFTIPILLTFVISLGAFCYAGKWTRSEIYDETERVYDKIFHGYNKMILPKMSDGSPVKVDHILSINQINYLDIENQVLSIGAWEMLIWQDHRLMWDSDYDDPDRTGAEIDSTVVSTDSVWVPDILLYNGDDKHDINVNLKVNAIASKKGMVTYIPPSHISSSCATSDHIQAGDYVNCTMIFGSWIHSANGINLVNSHGKASLAEYSDYNREWELVGTEVKRVSKIYDGFTSEYVTLHYIVMLRRKNHL